MPQPHPLDDVVASSPGEMMIDNSSRTLRSLPTSLDDVVVLPLMLSREHSMLREASSTTTTTELTLASRHVTESLMSPSPDSLGSTLDNKENKTLQMEKNNTTLTMAKQTVVEGHVVQSATKKRGRPKGLTKIILLARKKAKDALEATREESMGGLKPSCASIASSWVSSSSFPPLTSPASSTLDAEAGTSTKTLLSTSTPFPLSFSTLTSKSDPLSTSSAHPSAHSSSKLSGLCPMPSSPPPITPDAWSLTNPLLLHDLTLFCHVLSQRYGGKVKHTKYSVAGFCDTYEADETFVRGYDSLLSLYKAIGVEFPNGNWRDKYQSLDDTLL